MGAERRLLVAAREPSPHPEPGEAVLDLVERAQRREDALAPPRSSQADRSTNYRQVVRVTETPALHVRVEAGYDRRTGVSLRAPGGHSRVRIHGTRRIHEVTGGHEEDPIRVQEEPRGHHRTREDTPLRRFGTVRPRVQIPGPRPKSEFDDGVMAGVHGGAGSQPYHKLQPVYIEGRRTGRVAQRRVMMGTVTKAQVQRRCDLGQARSPKQARSPDEPRPWEF